jgi:anti-anti-sigma factor
VQSEFRVHVRNDQSGATIIAIAGELDLASSPSLDAEINRAFEAGVGLVIIDLRDLDFMDSTGLSVLIKAHQSAQQAGRRVCLVKGPPQVQRLLSLTGVEDRLTVLEAPEDARTGA